MSTLRLLIVGTGGIAGRHASVLAKIDEARIVGLCDVVPGKAAQFAAGQKIDAPAFTAAEEALAAAGPDAVLLCTPRGVRKPIIELCIRAGVPVMMEKPPCHDPATGREILALLQRSGLVHSVAFPHRYSPALNHVLDGIRAGGETLSLIAIDFVAPMASSPRTDSCPDPYLVARSGGLVGDQGIHYVDLCRYAAASEIRRTVALGGNRMLARGPKVTTVDTAAWAMEMDSGAIVSHGHTWCGHNWQCRVRLVTDRSDALVDMFQNTASGVLAGESFRFETGVDLFAEFDGENRAFLQAVRTGDVSPIRSNYADALRSFEAAEELNRQLYGAGADAATGRSPQ